ncbi:hypothetical protein MSAN_02286100 [Mycena sanguinolenta]|uniref:F-box domain-containing protein n=1 Tax=Mycena sanguinolenta TaxID=230812 RepID=A0A8H6X8H1_9AGAR|nr:hypothetical protein MSAN_02286100 [Mycena sanguinolenta]
MSSACSQCGAFVFSACDDFELSLTTRSLSRFTQLSTTNSPPRETELASIRSIVEKTSTHLASLGAEISRLTNRLRELEEERAAVARYHAQNTSICSPLRRMPTEILAEIFSWMLPSPRDIPSIHNSPWVLTHVCSRWRAVALSIPSLWSLVIINFKTGPHYTLEMVKTQIERARSLKIHFLGDQNGDPLPQIALFQLLAEHSAQWEELNIQLTSQLVPLLMNLHGNFASLRRAWVTWDAPESQLPEFDTVDVFRRAISLVDIGVYSEYRFLPTRLPLLHQLTRYDFDAPWQTHFELLKSIPNIQEVRIRIDFDAEEWPDVGEPVDLLHLRRLSVNNTGSLDYLRAPALEEIAVFGGLTDNTDIWDDLDNFVIRSSCSPRRLCLKGLPSQAMGAVLEKHPSLTELAVIELDGDDERRILSAFFHPPIRHPFCNEIATYHLNWLRMQSRRRHHLSSLSQHARIALGRREIRTQGCRTSVARSARTPRCTVGDENSKTSGGWIADFGPV